MRAYGHATRVISVLFVILGVIVIARTAAAGGEPLALGYILGGALVAIGIARLWLSTRLG